MIETFRRPLPFTDPRLGRHVVHDVRSRAYEHTPRGIAVGSDTASLWKIYGPRPVPNQKIGCCTGVDQAVKADAFGNRIPGRILGMRDAVAIYGLATELDDEMFSGHYPPVDTGSSALFACKAAQQFGIIDRYEWIFAGVDAVIEALRSRPVGVGTRWDYNMFHPDPMSYEIKTGGGQAGGHQWTLIGHDPKTRLFTGQCWWGPTFGFNGRFRMSYETLAELLADDGDAHVTYRVKA